MLRAVTVLAGILCALILTTISADAHPGCRGNICFQPQARTACLKPGVWSILHRLTAAVGPIEVTSGCNGRHARRSLHYSGRAADIRALYVPQSVAAAHLRRMHGVGGLGVEGHGLLHVDIGRVIEWRDVHTRYAGRHHYRRQYAGHFRSRHASRRSLYRVARYR